LSSVASLLVAGVLMGGCMADFGGESDRDCSPRAGGPERATRMRAAARAEASSVAPDAEVLPFEGPSVRAGLDP
jgi:hypothetical protein